MPRTDLYPARAAAEPPPFHCSSAHGALDAAWIHLAGALDTAAAPRLERTLRDAHAHTRLLVLDLRELTFIDPAGVEAIVDASRRARAIGRRLVLVRGRPDVYRRFTRIAAAGDIEIADLDASQPRFEAQRGRVSQSLLATG